MFTFTNCKSNSGNCRIKKKINLTPLVNIYNASGSAKKMHPVLQSYKAHEMSHKRAIKLKQYSTPIAVNTAVSASKSGGNVLLSYTNNSSCNNKAHKRIKSNQICVNIKINNNSVKHLNCVNNHNGYNRRYNYKYTNALSQDHLPIINNKQTTMQSNHHCYSRNFNNNNNTTTTNNGQRNKAIEIENSFISEIQSIIDDNNNTQTHTHTNANSNNELRVIYSKKRDIINSNRPGTSYAHIKLKNTLRTKSLSPN